MIPSKNSCPCSSGKTFETCCKPYLSGKDFAKDAVTLMRSRFSAYALANREYLLATWDRTTRPTDFSLDTITTWTRLEILKKQRGRPQDNKGSVEFIAHYEIQGQTFSLAENSQFVKKNLRWFYIDGKRKA